MTNRIFRSICFVAFIVFLSSMVLIMGVLYEYFSQTQQTQLKMQLALAAQGASHEGIAFFEDLDVNNCRITWINTDGTILFDNESDRSDMENHLEREEIREALASGYGESRRYSSTRMVRSLYAAQLLPDGTVLRLSVAQRSILTLLLGMLQPVLFVLMIAAALSVALAVRLSRNIVRPLNGMDLDHPLDDVAYEELSPLLRRIHSQQRQLRTQQDALEQKQNELNAMIHNMSEGLILLNEHGNILSINPAAVRLLNADMLCVGTELTAVCRDLELQNILTRALLGERVVRVIALGAGRYRVDASPVLAGEQTVGAVLCLFDVTEKEQAERLRREFTANVSHELKTPLHAISGYAELLQNGMVEKTDIVPFAGRIYGEAQRMIRLVNDIISLSHLDEGAEDLPREEVDLYALAAQAVRSLEPEAREAHVSLTLHGGPAVLYGVPPLLYSIVYNLCENAIKYNRADGQASVTVCGESAAVVLSVSDTGIGIPPDQQERVFERFYRVDKSRSKEVGGTGLGLSIVKHAALIHHAEIKVDSTMGQGTTVTVRFLK